MKRSRVRVLIPDSFVLWFTSNYPDDTLSNLMTELVVVFREKAEEQGGSVEDVISRIRLEGL